MPQTTRQELQDRIEKLGAELSQLQIRYDDLKDRSFHLESLLKNAQAFATYRLSVDPENAYRSRVVMVSDSLKDMLGVDDPWNQDEWFKITHPDDIDRMLAAQEQALKTFRLDETIRFFHSKRNEWRWVHVIATSNPEPSGQPHFFEGVLTDVTEMKTTELELEKYRTHLEKLVEQRTNELSISNQQLKKALNDNVLLFREMHHRVHNNLFRIMTLLELQSINTRSEVVLEAFQDCQDRIRAMCMVHRRLYMSEDPLMVDTDRYLGELTASILKAYGVSNGKVKLSQQTNGIVLHADQAVSLGFIINELIANTIKHNLAESSKTSIGFTLKHMPDKNEYEFTYIDNGSGFSIKNRKGQEPTLGLNLVTSLIESQLEGNIYKDNNSRADQFVFRFPSAIAKKDDADWQC